MVEIEREGGAQLSAETTRRKPVPRPARTIMAKRWDKEGVNPRYMNDDEKQIHHPRCVPDESVRHSTGKDNQRSVIPTLGMNEEKDAEKKPKEDKKPKEAAAAPAAVGGLDPNAVKGELIV